jgi:shikimate kinase
MKSNLALIGFMGVGKSVIGRALAEKMEKRFIEVDALIQRKAMKSIPQIFKDDGELAFRKLEIEVIKEVAWHKNQVIACGGGAVLNKINAERLQNDSIIIWLIASPGVIRKRTELNEAERPLLKGIVDLEGIRALLKTREPFYRQAADMKIDTSRLDVPSVVREIIARLKENANNGL